MKFKIKITLNPIKGISMGIHRDALKVKPKF